jgi:hypothetical protein
MIQLIYTLDRRLPRHQKRHSKYPVARLLRDHLGHAGCG